MSRLDTSSLRFNVLLSPILTTPTLRPGEWYRRADSAYQNKRYRSCIDLLNKAIYLSEHQAPDSQFDCRAAIRLRGCARRALGNYHAAVTDFQQLVAQDPLNPDNYLELACLHCVYDNPEAAAAVLSGGIQRMDQRRAAHLFLERGKIAAQNKEYLSAIDDFNVAIYYLPNRAEGWYHRGLLKSDIRAFRPAIRDGRQATLVDPGSPAAHYAYARILCRAERYREALLPLSRTIELAPNHHGPVSLLGRVLLLLKLREEARIFLDKAIEMGADDPATIQAHQRAFTRKKLKQTGNTPIDVPGFGMGAGPFFE